MYKNFNLTDQERKQILEQHQGKGYKQPLKEQANGPMQSVDPQIINYVVSTWGGPNAVTIKQSSIGTTITNNKTKSVLIFNLKTGMVDYDKAASIDIMPYSFGVGFEAFKKWFDSHNNYNPLSGFTNRTYIDEESLEEREVDENLGMLARIAAPMAASYVGSKMADTNEEDLNDKTPSNLVACSAVGVKFAGLCDKVTKKPVVECAKLGVKTIGYCFVDTKQPVNVATPKGQPLSELGGYIGNAPEKIDGPFMKEIDPSVYEDISYLDAMKADILLMRLYRSDIISKDAFLEVRKPIDEVVKILKGGYEEKQKDLPF